MCPVIAYAKANSFGTISPYLGFNLPSLYDNFQSQLHSKLINNKTIHVSIIDVNNPNIPKINNKTLLIIGMISCNGNSPNATDTFTEETNEKNSEETIIDESENQSMQSQDTEINPKDSPQLEFYKVFQEAIDSNQYDKWLEQELLKGERADKTIYSEYLALWKEELLFTIESAEQVFDNKDFYSQWKNELEQWMIHTQDILKLEMNLMGNTMNQLEVIIPSCELLRQKVIDTKKFLYYYENEKYGILDIDAEILIKWKYDNQ